ncbi:hypothetical protein NT239_15155 [Chitinibacter sp. SCUT-21]|uniref:hypothetical protein n=1 Tax=Chitinibacter sp. SCUT-21 TaxID=2970891 RepID=UPI0035A693BB
MNAPLIDAQKNTPRAGGALSKPNQTTHNHYTKGYNDLMDYRPFDSDSLLIAKLEAERINDGLEVQS